jgi:hypothetical protein
MPLVCENDACDEGSSTTTRPIARAAAAEVQIGSGERNAHLADCDRPTWCNGLSARDRALEKTPECQSDEWAENTGWQRGRTGQHRRRLLLVIFDTDNRHHDHFRYDLDRGLILPTLTGVALLSIDNR